MAEISNIDAVSASTGVTTNYTLKDSTARANIADTKDSKTTFTSSDIDDSSASISTGYTSVNKLVNTDTHATIFGKVSTMFKNIRYLYKLLGTTDISALSTAGTVTAGMSAMNTSISGKASSSHTHGNITNAGAIGSTSGNIVTTGTSGILQAQTIANAGLAAASHSHTTSDLPVVTSQTNDNTKIPSAGLVYSMNSTLSSLNTLYTAQTYTNGYWRNGIFRGKYLGTLSSTSDVDHIISEHSITNGTFDDLYLGDYFIINDGTYNVEWMIAGFNTEYNKGDTALTTMHISLIPRNICGTSYMNSSNTTSGGYVGSYMYTTTIPNIVAALQRVLSTHLLSRRVLLSNAINTSAVSPGYSGWTGVASSWSWYSQYATLMSEVQVYGSSVWGGGFDVGEGYEKLPVFNFISPVQYGRSNQWLRAVASSTRFAIVIGSGGANYTNASIVYGVRPLICIG